MFLRFVGQSVGASGCGAVLNATVSRVDPGAAGLVDRLLDPVARRQMPPVELGRLIDVLAVSLHNAYLLATAFALLTLMIAWQMPARLRP